MKETYKGPPAPSGLKVRGAAFWAEMHQEIEFETKESTLVEEACRTLDRIESLQSVIDSDGVTITGSTGQTIVHPAIPELRQQQLAFGRLMSLVHLPEDVEAGERSRHNRAKSAAAGRWERPTALRAVNRG